MPHFTRADTIIKLKLILSTVEAATTKWECTRLKCCLAGKYVLAWKRGIAILTAGAVKVTPDDRFRLVDGYNLEIRDVQTNDAGNYVCQIATLQPREITHTLEIMGNYRVVCNIRVLCTVLGLINRRNKTCVVFVFC